MILYIDKEQERERAYTNKTTNKIKENMNNGRTV